MLLIPTGTQEYQGRRQPYGSVGIVVLLCLVFGLTKKKMERQNEEAQVQLMRVVEVWMSHPYTVLPPRVLDLLPPQVRQQHERFQKATAQFDRDPHAAIRALSGRRSADRLEEMLGGVKNYGDLQNMANSDAAIRTQVHTSLARDMDSRPYWQGQVDELATAFANGRDRSLAGKFGWVPTRKSAPGLFGHMFLHGGWLHLLFNLLFFWAAAVALEDYWSAPGIVFTYLFTASCGAFAHAWVHPDSVMPMIGASGAVAGMLGAFSVRLWDRSLRYFYLYFIGVPRYGSFTAPAWIMLPMWFAGEVFSAMFLDFGGIAYWAHVGGFVGGMTLAIAVKLADLEKRFLGYDPVAEAAAEYQQAADLIASLPPANHLGHPPSPGPPRPAAPPATAPTDGTGSYDVIDTPVGESVDLTTTPPPDERDYEGPTVAWSPTDGVPLTDAGVPDPRDTLLQALRAKDDHTAVGAFFEMAARHMEPDLPAELDIELGRALFGGGFAEQAASSCERAARRYPRGPHAARALYMAARIYADTLQRHHQAAFLCNRVIERYPGDPWMPKAAELAQRVSWAG